MQDFAQVLYAFWLQPFQKEVKDYKPKVTENARLGAIYDKMIYETEINIATRPHYRSTELDLTKPIDRRVFEEPKFIEDREYLVQEDSLFGTLLFDMQFAFPQAVSTLHLSWSKKRSLQ